MATLTVPPAQPSPMPRRFTVAEYHQLIEIGLLRPEDRCELIRGNIVYKMPANPAHSSAVRSLDRLFQQLVGESAVVSAQQPITLDDSEPEPDLVLGRPPESRYRTAHPTPDDIFLVVEVSDTSLAYDQGGKLALYAESKVLEYWIVNLSASRVEVHTQPRRGKTPSYRQRREYGPDDAIPVTIGGTVVGSIPVREILPK